MNSSGVENALWRAGRDAVLRPSGTPRASAISARDLGARQHAAVAGLGALATA